MFPYMLKLNYFNMKEGEVRKINIECLIAFIELCMSLINLTIFGIYSFNRDNYNNPVTMTAFKKSGAIEYSSVFIMLVFKHFVEGKYTNGFISILLR